MKKILALGILTIAILTLLTACGTKATCEFCGEEKNCTTTQVLGEDVYVCGDCTAELKEFTEGGF